MLNCHCTTTQCQSGITGLETAIILIAFVVVASVFAFTVLTSGIFSTERSKETVFAGLEEARSSFEPRGSVISYAGDIGGTDRVYKVTFGLSNAIAGAALDLTPPYSADGTGFDPDLVSAAETKTTISYSDPNQHFGDVPWSITFHGDDNGDTLLEGGEKAEITVWLLRRDNGVADPTATDGAAYYSGPDANGSVGIESGGTLLGTNDSFTMEVVPSAGAVLTIQRTIPPRINSVTDLK